jgi:hypothetical protein
MTTYTNTNGKCPHCKRTIDAKKAILTFPGNVTGKKISLAFALCLDCYDAFKHGDTNQQTDIIKTSYINVVNNQNADWSVTNSLALHAHQGDFFSAWWVGIDLPQTLFDAINDGLIDEFAFFPPLSCVTGVRHV